MKFYTFSAVIDQSKAQIYQLSLLFQWGISLDELANVHPLNDLFCWIEAPKHFAIVDKVAYEDLKCPFLISTWGYCNISTVITATKGSGIS